MVVTRDGTPPRSELIGQRCGGSYQITRLLGEGGMGQVYLASSELLAGTLAAVKVLPLELLRRPEALARFRNEQYAAGKIQDPNIVKVFDAGEFPDGRLYMIMEYCPGGSLSELLEKRGALAFEVVLAIAAQVGSALDAAHTVAKITHRDVKPANILLMFDPGSPVRARLADFGIVKLHDGPLGNFRTSAAVLGSPGYIAPEQTQGKGPGAVDHRADIYSFASVLYEMVTGRRPYPGNSIYDLINNVQSNAPFPRPRELRPDLSPSWEEIIMTGLAHQREDRIQSVKELVRRLARTLPNGEALMSYVAPRLVEHSVAPTAATISDAIGPAATQWAAAHSTGGYKRGSRIARTLATLVVGVAVGGGATVLVERSHSSKPSTTNGSANDSPIALAVPPSTPTPTSTPLDASSIMQPIPADAATRVVTIPPGDAALDAPRIAAGPPDAPREPAPRDAAVAVVADTRRPPHHIEPAAHTIQAPADPGTLKIEVEPWADIAIAGQKETYTTPLTKTLPAGHYRVVLSKGSQRETVDVTITPNQMTRITRSW